MSATYFRHALPVGEILGDYEVISVLGAGGFGVTYLVQHRTMGDRFAIKEYFPQSLADRENSGTVVIRTNTFEDSYYKGLHGFLEEARIVRRLRGHPNVVHVNSFFEANNTAYMVMEYYAGQTLTSFRKQCGDSFDEAAIRRMMIPVLDALEYIHQREVVHRDLKPDNVFLCEDGRPILLDFGASRFAAAGGTVPMTAVLTPGFAPPEQYISEDSGETILRQGPWTDLYALGAMLHMLASGRAPYDAMSRQMSGAQDPQPPAHTRLPGYSMAFCSAVDACLRLDMKQRPQSVAQFREIWDLGMAGLPSGVIAPPVPLVSATGSSTAAQTTVPAPVPAPAQTRANTGSPTSPAPARPVSAPPIGPGPGPGPIPPPHSIPARSTWPLWAGAAVLLAGGGAGTWWMLRPTTGTAPLTTTGLATPAATGTLMVFSDLACQLKVNGADQGMLEPGLAKTLSVPPGEQAVECIVDGDVSQTHRHTKTVAAGQQAVVELVLTETALPEDPAVLDPLADLVVYDMLAPDFQEASGAVTNADAPIGEQLSSASADAADTETWFASNGLSLAYAPGPTSMAPAPSWTAEFVIPDFVALEYDGQPLLKVIDSGEQIISLYGENFSRARILIAQNAADGTGLYGLDFTTYANAPQRIEADRDFVNQQIIWAQQLDGVLYVSHGHNTYAKSSYGRNAYITAFDTTQDFMTLWHSPALVSNSSNFIIHGDHIISGYGFTDEPDFLYALERFEGKIVQRIPVKSGPDFLISKDEQLFVRVYDTDYVFELK